MVYLKLLEEAGNIFFSKTFQTGNEALSGSYSIGFCRK
jgi:hypothetical protein